MIDVILFILIGIVVGFFAGILPGIHPNQVFVILISLLPKLSNFSETSLVGFVMSITVSNVIFNYIPTIFFSVPDPETVINVLPGHRMVLEGKGMDALFISLCGSIFTLIFCIITLPLLINFIPILNNFLYPYLHILLVVLTVYMGFLEKSWRKKICFTISYFLSGFWGILTLNSVLINSDDALFPALTGMFGIAGILLSLNDENCMPQQKFSKNIDIGNVKKIVLSSIIAGLLVGVLPGAGESQAGVLISQMMKIEQKEFLGVLSGINSSNMFFALISLYSFNKVRSGSAAAIKEIVGGFTLKNLIFSIGVMLLSGGISILLSWVLGKKCLEFLEKIDYKKLSIIILIFTSLMVLIITGIFGIFIMIISTCIGILPILWGIKRTSNMGYLMFTTTLYFSGLNWLVNEILFCVS